MKKKLILIAVILCLSNLLSAQNKINLYDPEAKPENDIAKALEQAKSENKNVILQIGGNWCPWCVKLHKVFNTESKIDSILKKDYLLVRVNYSKENKNWDILKKYEFPQRFGFPVLVVLNSDGKRLHTQDTGFFETENGYDNKKIMAFLRNWTVRSLEEKSYEMK